MNRSLATRLLHLLLAAAIIHQLVISFFMQMPDPQGRPGNFGFELHEAVGIASLGVLISFWIWTLVRRREVAFSALLPWFSAERLEALIRDFRVFIGAIRKFELPQATDDSPISNAVHGLGLILASTMAVSGAVIYLAMGTDGTVEAFGAPAMTVHRSLANFMWAYLVGHASIALLHQINGRHALERMFVTGGRPYIRHEAASDRR